MLPRYYSYIQFEDYFQKLLNTLDGSVLKDLVIGESVLKRSIYGLKIGSGKVKILAWSQMHGNESSTTRAICELLRSSDLEHMLENIELYIIPILNPDGADNWTRVNANNVDLNRDAVLLSQPESIVLRKVFDDFQPHYCFNLHGQRSIYGSK
ncbi:MAG: murein tripeptide amidase MpaA, partial [Nonlabens sp.]